jgi:hypothetical protein
MRERKSKSRKVKSDQKNQEDIFLRGDRVEVMPRGVFGHLKNQI